MFTKINHDIIFEMINFVKFRSNIKFGLTKKA